MKKLVYLILLFFASVIVGSGLLIGVYMLPVEPMYRNLQKTAQTYDTEAFPSFPRENYYPDKTLQLKSIVLNNKCTVLDNYTDAIMLNTASYKYNGSPVQGAMSITRYEISDASWWNPTNSLLQYANNTTENNDNISVPTHSYARYWHGYLVILKPLMLLFDYTQIRIINAIVQLFLMIILIKLIWNSIDKKYLCTFLYSWLFIFPVSIPLMLQYSWVYYVMMISSILMLKYYDMMNKKKWFVYYFMLVGIVTSYVDLLTYPIITLGIPLTFMVILDAYSSHKEKCITIIKNSIIWGIGYGAMWAAKWVIASIILHKDILGEAIAEATLRTGSVAETGDFRITSIAAIVANVSIYSNIIYVLLIAIGLIVVFVKMHKYHWKISNQIIPYGLLIIMPLVWYAILKQHSFYHGVFTYKALMVTVFSGMSMLISTYEQRGN